MEGGQVTHFVQVAPGHFRCSLCDRELPLADERKHGMRIGVMCARCVGDRDCAYCGVGVRKHDRSFEFCCGLSETTWCELEHELNDPELLAAIDRLLVGDALKRAHNGQQVTVAVRIR